MKILPDLHLHSDQSDGVLSPEALADSAAAQGVTLMALTDHDTFDGSDRLRNRGCPIPLLPGVELGLRDMKGLHLLAYGSAEGTELRETVRTLQDKRIGRAEKMLTLLTDLGMPLSWQDISTGARGSIGRPHLARAMVRAGYVRSLREAFDRYLGEGKPAYVPAERLSMEEALLLTRKSGFIPVLAHPYELDLPEEELFALVSRWKEMGLQGMEVYHPSAIRHGFAGLEQMAGRLGLLVTGGSDFHQTHDGKHGEIGCMGAYWTKAGQDIDRLQQAIADAKG